MRPAPALVLLLGITLAPSLAAQLWPNDNQLRTGQSQAASDYGHAVAIGDINGDGIDDLVIGAPLWDDVGDGEAANGRIEFYFGTANRELVYDSAFWAADATTYAGWAIALGNFDDDAALEVAVGAPGADVLEGSTQAGAGLVWIFGWNGSTMTLVQIFTQVALDGSAAEAGDNLGDTLATGNFNGDDYDDLAIGVPFEDLNTQVDAGMIHVLYGSASGLTFTGQQFFFADNLEAGTSNPGDHFGWALAAGNFKGGGFEDLAIGAPFRTVSGFAGAGQVHVAYGSETGLLATGDQLLDELDVPGGAAAAGEHFGYALAAGNFDSPGVVACLFGGNCAGDLAIGVPGQDVFYDGAVRPGAGWVRVFYGSESLGGLSLADVDTVWQDPAISPLFPEDFDSFGTVLASGQLDNEGFLFNRADLIVGVPSEDVPADQSGVIQLFFGDDSGLDPAPSQFRFASPGFASAPAEVHDAYGAAIAIGDLDGDGWGDAAVGIPGKDGHGAVQVMYGALFANDFETSSYCQWSAPLCL